MRIPLFKPHHTQQENDAVAEVLRSGWTGQGPKVEEFEKQFAERVGAKYAVATNSCTAALTIALRLVGDMPGEVIVPACTFVATAMAVETVGKKPLFGDVDKQMMLTPQAIRLNTSQATQAVIPVMYAGTVRYYEEHTKLPIIYDCAHACGGLNFQAAGRLCCWSFHAVKNLSCGDGGMLTTDNLEHARAARMLRWHGIDRGTHARSAGAVPYRHDYNVTAFGYKATMTDITAAIGLVQLARLEAMRQARHDVAACYNDCGLWDILTPYYKDVGTSYHLFPAYAKDQKERDGLITHLGDHGIDTGVHYKPLYLHPHYVNQGHPPAEQAEANYARIISLPMFPEMTEEQVKYVVKTIRSYYADRPAGN